MSQVDTTLPYRPCVGIVLINRDGLVWSGHRVMGDLPPDAPRWQLPQGGIDAGEVFYKSFGKNAGLNSQYNFEMMRWSAFLSFVFTFLGGLMLYYSDRPNNEKL